LGWKTIGVEQCRHPDIGVNQYAHLSSPLASLFCSVCGICLYLFRREGAGPLADAGEEMLQAKLPISGGSSFLLLQMAFQKLSDRLTYYLRETAPLFDRDVLQKAELTIIQVDVCPLHNT
jgi:hypothetical protein